MYVQGWYLVSASFGYDPPSGRTILGAVWLTADLTGTCVGHRERQLHGRAVHH